MRQTTLPAPPERSTAAAEALEARRLLAAHLVEDINTLPASPYGPPVQPTAPTQPVSMGAYALFANIDTSQNGELWRTDGTAAGTHLLKDLRPGDKGSFPSGIVRAGDLAFFSAQTNARPDGNAGPQFWRTDGTEAGTFLLDIPNRATNPFGFEGVTHLTAVGDRVFFFSDDGVHGRELWTSDGSPAGTRLVKDLTPGPADSFPRFMAPAGDDRLLLQVAGPTSDIVVTNGTEDGTQVVGSLEVAAPVRAGDAAYLIEDWSGSFWRLDGTGAAVNVLDTPFLGGRVLSAVGTADGAVFVNVRPLAGPTRLYRYHPSNGLTEVTSPTGQATGEVSSLTAVGSTVYFSGNTGPAQVSLLRVAPSQATAAQVPGVAQFPHPIYLTGLTPAGDALFFRANQREVWHVPDPGAAATRLGQLPFDLARNRVPLGLTPFADGVLSVAYDLALGWALYRTDVTPPETRLLTDLSPTTEDASPTQLTPFNGKALFVANDGVSGAEPWITDGTAAGTFRLADANRSGASEPALFTQVGLRAFFAVRRGEGGAELWVTDGTAAGTRRVRVVRPGPQTESTLNLWSLTPAGRPGEEFLLFLADDGVRGQALWRSDGTEAGTVMVADVRPDVSRSDTITINSLEPFGDGTVLFPANDGVHGWELWRSDGTAEGTYLLKNVAPDDGGPADSTPAQIARAGAFAYFSAVTPGFGRELWRTDGTPEGTVLVADIAPGPASSEPGAFNDQETTFTEFGGNVYFMANARGTGHELYRTDGTAQGTVLVAGAGTLLLPTQFRVMDGGLYFRAFDPAALSPSQIWRTDGTAAGTVPVIPAGMTAGSVGDLTVIDGRLYFRASLPESAPGSVPGVSQWELFSTDGTPAGTMLMDNLGDDRRYAHILDGITGLAGGSVVVPGDDGIAGAELFLYDPVVPTAAAVIARHAFYNRSGFDGNDGAADARDDAAVATDKHALLPGQSASFANVTSYTHGLNGIMVDIANLPAGDALGPDDFEIGGDGTRVMNVSVRRGAGANGSDRVTLTWPDYDTPTDPPTIAVGNGWLQVIVRANANTGLATPDVFSFGNLIGDTGDSPTTFRVNALDLAAVKRALNAPTSITSPTDFNRDGRTNALDLATVKRALGQDLAMPPALAEADRRVRRVADEVLAPA